jgi:hypothetical protein
MMLNPQAHLPLVGLIGAHRRRDDVITMMCDHGEDRLERDSSRGVRNLVS